MTDRLTSTRPPTLTVHFQGLCSFLRDREDPARTREVTVILVAGERAPVRPGLCAHTPVLIFHADEFIRFRGGPSLATALIPGRSAAPSNPRPALGVWRLAGRELRVVGARRRRLRLFRGFETAADLHLLTGRGAVKRSVLGARPPRLVAGRVLLTSGSLSTSHNVGDDGDPDDRWVFDVESASPTTGTPVPFAQEIHYRFRGDPLANEVVLRARPIGGGGRTETLALIAGATVAICNLCPQDHVPVTKERDFLAYYPLLRTRPARAVIPHRLPNPNGDPPARVGLSACPPSTTFV